MTLNSLLAGLRRRWFIVLAFIVIGGLAAGAYVAIATPVYQGETRLFVSMQTTTTNTPADLVAGNNFAAQKVSAYVEIAYSQRVLDQVAAEIGGDPAELADKVLATSLPNSAVITITADSPNPDDAALLANTVASVFSNIVVNQIESPVGGGPGPVKVEILAAAEAPEDPVSPNLLLSLALGLFGGFLVGFAVAIVLTLTDRRVRSRADIIGVLDRPVLGTVTSTRSRSGAVSDVVIADFRALAATMTSLGRRQSLTSVAIASPTALAPASETTAGLAQALAESGLSTVVIDAVLTGGGVSDYFAATDRLGLRDVLAGTARLADAVTPTELDRLSVLPIGIADSVTSSALSSTAFTAVIEQLSISADFVVIDAGAVLGTADAVAARASADQAVIVIDTGKSTKTDLVSSVEQLEIIGTPLLGVVVAKRRRRAKGQRITLAATAKPAPAESPDRILSS